MSVRDNDRPSSSIDLLENPKSWRWAQVRGTRTEEDRIGVYRIERVQSSN